MLKEENQDAPPFEDDLNITEKETELTDSVTIIEPEARIEGTTILPEKVQNLSVQELRQLARVTPYFPIQGREISKANRKQLLDYFASL